jgi:hypothetical protein
LSRYRRREWSSASVSASSNHQGENVGWDAEAMHLSPKFFSVVVNLDHMQQVIGDYIGWLQATAWQGRCRKMGEFFTRGFPNDLFHTRPQMQMDQICGLLIAHAPRI